MVAPAEYDINEIFDALRNLFNELDTGDEIGGQAVLLAAYSEVAGNVDTPAMVLELDDITWDETMGGGEDTLTIMATVLVQDVDTKGAQRKLRAFLSRKATAGMARLKAQLDTDPTLGGLVSFVHMGQARQIGRITYDQVDYMGVALPLEVVS